MFFCRHWSVGKAIDAAAALAGLRNDNNQLTAKVTAGTPTPASECQRVPSGVFAYRCDLCLSQQKLRLCHVTSGAALPLDHTLQAWLTEEDCPLCDGGDVILEYLSDDEQVLKDVDSYFE